MTPSNRPAGRGIVLALVVVGAVLLLPGATAARAATPSQVSGAEAQIQSAFVATHSAEMEGGNVTSLVALLDQAVEMVQTAEQDNSTNPAVSAADLANATQIAMGVSAQAGPVGQAGASARQAELYVSLGSAAAIVGVAGAAHALGDRLVRRVWLRLYSKHLVRKVG